MTDTQTVVEDYLAAWNERDPEARRALVALAFTEDATYLDPLVSGSGIDGIAAMIGGAQEQFPGHRIELSFGPDMHNDRVLFGWTLRAESGPPVAHGTDFAVVAADGRFREVTGFLEPAAAAA
jgi:hypothetical protein